MRSGEVSVPQLSSGNVIDVSAPINWSAAVSGGVRAVIIKATEGSTYVSPTYLSSRSAARSAGLAVASYHFLRTTSSADKQAFWYSFQADPALNERMILDAEPYQGQTPALSDVMLFINTLRDARPNPISLYGPESYLTSIGAAQIPGVDLWVANWTREPAIPYALWQYIGNQKQYGGVEDPNIFNGSETEMLAWFGAAPAADLSTVKGLQTALIGAGYKITTDGFYGPQTGAALSQATYNGKSFVPPSV